MIGKSRQNKGISTGFGARDLSVRHTFVTETDKSQFPLLFIVYYIEVVERVAVV